MSDYDVFINKYVSACVCVGGGGFFVSCVLFVLTGKYPSELCLFGINFHAIYVKFCEWKQFDAERYEALQRRKCLLCFVLLFGLEA